MNSFSSSCLSWEPRAPEILSLTRFCRIPGNIELLLLSRSQSCHSKTEEFHPEDLKPFIPIWGSPAPTPTPEVHKISWRFQVLPYIQRISVSSFHHEDHKLLLLTSWECVYFYFQMYKQLTTTISGSQDLLCKFATSFSHPEDFKLLLPSWQPHSLSSILSLTRTYFNPDNHNSSRGSQVSSPTTLLLLRLSWRSQVLASILRISISSFPPEAQKLLILRS